MKSNVLVYSIFPYHTISFVNIISFIIIVIIIVIYDHHSLIVLIGISRYCDICLKKMSRIFLEFSRLDFFINIWLSTGWLDSNIFVDPLNYKPFNRAGTGNCSTCKTANILWAYRIDFICDLTSIRLDSKINIRKCAFEKLHRYFFISEVKLLQLAT